MKGYDRYLSVISDWSGEVMKPVYVDRKKGKKTTIPNEEFFRKIFYGFTEIKDSLESLQLSERLVGSNPPRLKNLPLDEYLRYHVNAYLQEMYILQQRLSTYTKWIDRVYRKAPVGKKIKKTAPSLNEYIYKSLENIIKRRGAHVHQMRYDDEDLKDLSISTLISIHKKEFEEDAKFTYQLTKTKWHAKIKKNNVDTLKVLDEYFDEIHDLIVDDGKIIEPNKAVVAML